MYTKNSGADSVGVTATATMRTGFRVVTTVAVLALVTAGCDESTSGTVALNAEKSQHSLNDRDVHIPQQWVFGQMDKGQVFVGAPSYFGRYDSPSAANALKLQPVGTLVGEIRTSNPSFPPMREVDCSEMPIDGLGQGYLVFACTDATTVYSTTRGVDGLAGTPSQSDSDTLLLTYDDRTAHLFVVLQGH